MCAKDTKKSGKRKGIKDFKEIKEISDRLAIFTKFINFPKFSTILRIQHSEAPRPNLLSEGVRLGLDMKLARMGHTRRISHSSQ